MYRKAGVYSEDKKQSSKSLLQKVKLLLNWDVLVERDLWSHPEGESWNRR